MSNTRPSDPILALEAIMRLRRSSNSGFSEQIIGKLFDYCRELDQDLDKKTGLAAKYFKVPPVSHSAEAEEKDSKKRKAFLYSGNSFYKFCEKLYQVLALLTPQDIATIRTDEETPLAKEFRQCVDILNDAGFYNVNGKPINFWSGEEAQEMANTVLTSLSDSNVPAISILSKLGMLLKDSHRALSDKMFGAGSAEFTGQASGDVLVYSSAANVNEPEPVLTVGNFHWNVELPILIKLKMKGIVKNIQLVHFLHVRKNIENGQWLQTVESRNADQSSYVGSTPPLLPDEEGLTSNIYTTSYVGSMSLPLDHVDLPALSCDDASYTQTTFSTDCSYVGSSSLSCDYVGSIENSFSYAGSTSSTLGFQVDENEYYLSQFNLDDSMQPPKECKGHWLYPVPLSRVRLVDRRPSLHGGTALEKKADTQFWKQNGDARAYIPMSEFLPPTVPESYFDFNPYLPSSTYVFSSSPSCSQSSSASTSTCASSSSSQNPSSHSSSSAPGSSVSPATPTASIPPFLSLFSRANDGSRPKSDNLESIRKLLPPPLSRGLSFQAITPPGIPSPSASAPAAIASDPVTPVLGNKKGQVTN